MLLTRTVANAVSHLRSQRLQQAQPLPSAICLLVMPQQLRRTETCLCRPSQMASRTRRPGRGRGGDAVRPCSAVALPMAAAVSMAAWPHNTELNRTATLRAGRLSCMKLCVCVCGGGNGFVDSPPNEMSDQFLMFSQRLKGYLNQTSVLGVRWRVQRGFTRQYVTGRERLHTVIHSDWANVSIS